MKRITTFLLVLSLLLSFGCAFALTPGDRLVVVGADLTQTQIESVYETFGLHRGEVPELTITSRSGVFASPTPRRTPVIRL